MKEWVKTFFSKLLSVKVWCVLLAGFLLTYIVMNNLGEFNNVAMFLCGVIISYCGINVAQDFIQKK